jgi:hypothetical protein
MIGAPGEGIAAGTPVIGALAAGAQPEQPLETAPA